MVVDDDQAAIACLRRMGYYRLSGYFYPLRQTKPRGQIGRLDGFVPGTTFDLIVQLAEFDKHLRLLVLNAIETIEVALRVQIAHYLGQFDAEAHLNPKLLNQSFVQGVRGPSHDKWIARFNDLATKSKEEFVVHHLNTYGGRMPIWVAVELWDFGTLSMFFSGMAAKGQRKIAQQCALEDGYVLSTWLKSLSFFRNVAAHHSRMWNRTTTWTPRIPTSMDTLSIAGPHNKLFATLCCARYLMRTIHPHSVWHTRLKEHCQTFPETPLLSLRDAGFTDDWQNTALWE